ncbi:MAG TPA: hypothetical protein DEB39_06390, partial [Planctomycetaceae bacterium]|nr:hypothetical protein [Planctomycetaceae bacterium]
MMEEIAVPFNSSDVDVVPSPANPMSIHGIPGADAYCIMVRSRRNDVYPPVGQDYVALILVYDFSGNLIARRYCPTKKYGPRVFYAGFTGYIDPNSFEPYWFLQTYRDFRESRIPGFFAFIGDTPVYEYEMYIELDDEYEGFNTRGPSFRKIVKEQRVFVSDSNMYSLIGNVPMLCVVTGRDACAP